MWPDKAAWKKIWQVLATPERPEPKRDCIDRLADGCGCLLVTLAGMPCIALALCIAALL